MRAESEGKTGIPSQTRRPTKNSTDDIANPADGRGTALSQALLSLELDMEIMVAGKTDIFRTLARIFI